MPAPEKHEGALSFFVAIRITSYGSAVLDSNNSQNILNVKINKKNTRSNGMRILDHEWRSMKPFLDNRPECVIFWKKTRRQCHVQDMFLGTPTHIQVRSSGAPSVGLRHNTRALPLRAYGRQRPARGLRGFFCIIG
jgi:hypothetical protein